MSERMQILEQIESGEISAEEGIQRLEALAQPEPSPEIPTKPPAWVRRIWLAVFRSAVVLALGGGLLLVGYYAWEAGAGSAICGWPLLVVGVLGLLLGIWLQGARWFFLRVREHGSRRITLAFPLPLGPVAWILRIVRPFVPQLQEIAVDELILALREELRNGRPFVVDVNGGENGEQVHVYFG